MKLFPWLFVGWFGVESVLFGIANATHPLNAGWYFLIFPAIWIAMAVGGVHSAGLLSVAIGLATTALLYAVLTATLVFVASRLRGHTLRKRAMKHPPTG
jgi:purine-cytosine permease-like protein